MAQDVRLTALVAAGGCARKLGAADLQQVLGGLTPFAHAWVDGSVGTMDDAAVLRPPGGGTLILTVDFITPVVDDAETFGAIAATNALSDVYAMGGEPQAALAVCAFPAEQLALEVLQRILRGGRDKAAEAGCAIVGGHTIKGPELTYGLCVIGSADPERVWTQTGAQAGDVLVLTKPLGFGIAAQANKQQALPDAERAVVVGLMTTLNKAAKDAGLAASAHAATDVTGFGLLNHLRNLALASGLAAHLRRDAVPVLDFIPALARAGYVPGGSTKNLATAAPFCDFAADLDEIDRLLLADAQTSGGLLLAVPAARVDALLADLKQRGAPAHAVVGELTAGEPGRISISR